MNPQFNELSISTATVSGRKAPVSIVGAGHWMLTHDRVGPRVLELLAGRYDEARIELCEAGTSGLGLLDFMRGQELMVIVDACILGKEPGTIEFGEPDFDAPVGRESSVHQLGPVETLQVARHLQPEILPQQTLLVLVETDGIDEETHERACQEVVGRLDEYLTAYLSGAAAPAEMVGNPSKDGGHG